MNNKYPNIKAYLVGLKKKTGLENQLSNIHTLVLGSSHGQYSFVPEKGEYNLCLPSQDLYYSYSLYKKYACQLKNLKKIVLFYSVFSRGMELVKTNEDFRCYHYEKVFGISPSRTCYSKKIHEKYGCYDNCIESKAQKLRIPKFYRGENPDVKGLNVYRIGSIDPAVRASAAYKHHQRKIIQDKYIIKMMNLARKNNHHITLILSPAHRDYKKALPSERELFADIFSMICTHDNEMLLLDFYNRDDFSDNEWWDYDHLNPDGAKKFTKIYRSMIEK